MKRPVIRIRKIFGRLAAICLVSLLPAPVPAETNEHLFMIPVMENPVVIDGTIEETEWKKAAKVSGFFDQQGNLVLEGEGYAWIGTDGTNLYVAVKTATGMPEPGAGVQKKTTQRDGAVWEDDAVELFISPDEKNVYQIIVNSIGTVFDASYPFGGMMNKGWNSPVKTAHTVQLGWWNCEIAVPLESVGNPDGKMKIRICRDWVKHGPSAITATGAQWTDPQTMAPVGWGKNYPAVQINGIGDFVNGDLTIAMRILNEAKDRLIVQATIGDDRGNVKYSFQKTINDSWEGKEKAFVTRQKDRYRLRVTVSKEKDSPLFAHTVFFTSGRSLAQKSGVCPVTGEAMIDGLGLISIRHYPSFQRLQAEIDPRDWRGNEIRTIEVLANGPAGETRTARAEKDRRGLWNALVELQSEAKGTWRIDCVARDGGGRELLKKTNALAFEKKTWEWENGKLGVSDAVIPPFSPFQVQQNDISCIFRTHTVNALGLWDQVRAKEKEILSSPMQLIFQVNGKEQPVKTQPLQFTAVADNKVITRGSASAGDLQIDTRSVWDYDGMMWYTVRLSSATTCEVAKMTLVVQMKSEECSLMNVVADYSRKNISRGIPNGSGETWNSSVVVKKEVRGKKIIDTEMVPYIWLGGEERGLCWFADSSRGMNLEDGAPAIRIIRPSETVVQLEIDIINRTTAVREERLIEFGLQATPVKPMPEGWRNWLFINQDTDPCGNLTNMFKIGFWVKNTIAGMKYGWDKYPVDNDYAFAEYMKNVCRTKRVDPDFVKNYRSRVEPKIVAWAKKNRESLKQCPYLRGRTVEKFVIDAFESYQNMWEKRALGGLDRLVLYQDPRLETTDNPETEYFAAEWWNPQPISYEMAIRTFPTGSHIDYLLNNWKKLFEHGIDGIGMDDCHIMPNNNPCTEASVDPEGRIHSRIGILAMRELIRRMAVIQHQLGMKPILIAPHITDNFVIPYASFATVYYNWEMNYGEDDFQNRFSPDYIRSQSIGLQAGIVPVVLAGIQQTGAVSPEEWKKKKKRLTRTLLAVCLIHEIKNELFEHMSDTAEIMKAQSVLNSFGTAEKDCQFIPYWDHHVPVAAAGADFRISLYTRPGEALIIVANMEDDAVATIKFDKKTLRLPDTAVFCNLLTDDESRENRMDIRIPKHEYLFVYGGAPERGRELRAVFKGNTGTAVQPPAVSGKP